MVRNDKLSGVATGQLMNPEPQVPEHDGGERRQGFHNELIR